MNERGGHPPGPPDIDQPGIGLGQGVLRRVVQDQAAHRGDPGLHGAGDFRQADEPEQGLGLGGLVGSCPGV